MRGYPADPEKDYRHAREAHKRLDDPGQSAEGWDKRVWDEVQRGAGHADLMKGYGAQLTDIGRAQAMGGGRAQMAAGDNALQRRAAMAQGGAQGLQGLGQANQARLRSDLGGEQMRVDQWKTGIGALLGQQKIEGERYGIEKGAQTDEMLHQKELDRMEDDFWFNYGMGILGGGMGAVGSVLAPSDEGMKREVRELRSENAILKELFPQEQWGEPVAPRMRESVYSPDAGGPLSVYVGDKGPQRAAFLRPSGETEGPWRGSPLGTYEAPGPMSPGTAPMTSIGSDDYTTLVGSDERLKSKVAELRGQLKEATSQKEEIQRVAAEALGQRPFPEQRPLQRVASEAARAGRKLEKEPRLKGGEEGTEFLYEAQHGLRGGDYFMGTEGPVEWLGEQKAAAWDEYPAVLDWAGRGAAGKEWEPVEVDLGSKIWNLSDEAAKKELQAWKGAAQGMRPGLEYSKSSGVYNQRARDVDTDVSPRLSRELSRNQPAGRAGMTPADIGDAPAMRPRPQRQRWGNPIQEVMQKTPLLEYEYNEQAQRDYGMPGGRRVGTSANRLRAAGPLGRKATALGPRGEVMIKPDEGVGLALGMSAQTGRENMTQDAQLHELARRLERLEHGRIR